MTTAFRADERSGVVESHVVQSQPPPFDYPQEASYARQLFLNAVVAIVLAAITVVIASPLLGISA
jgi:hypothetical protein